MKKQLLVAGFVFFSFMSPLKASAANFSQLYVFGDSLSDTGNVFNATGGTTPASPPSFNGRFSNGPMWVDYLGDDLGIHPALVTDLNNGNPSQGINFAYGGSGSGLGNAFLPDAPFPGILGQVNLFAQSLLANNQTADPNALYAVWTRGNDLLFTDPTDSATPITNITQALNTLVSVGARNLLVFNLPDLAQVPIVINGSIDPAIYTQSTNEYNAGLGATLSVLSQNPNLHVIPVDAKGLFNRLVATPSEFGFNNTTDFCLDVSTNNIVCQGDPNTFVFWDVVHPSTTTHRLIADTTLAAIRAQQVPESSAIFGLLGFGVLGAAGALKRQQKKLAVTTSGPVFNLQPSCVTVEN